MFWWCDDRYSKDCPVLGLGIHTGGTNNLAICEEYKFWQDKPCYNDDWIRCRAGYSGKCAFNKYWGVEGAKDDGKDVITCKDGSDLYRPIVKGEEPGSQQMWKAWPVSEWRYNRDYKGKVEWANYTKDNKSGLWMIPESDPFKVPSITEEDFEKGPRLFEDEWKRKEEWADFYSSDNYVKDETTKLMMAPTTEETCKANNGFVCKV